MKFFKYGLMSAPGKASADHLKIGNPARKRQDGIQPAASTELIRRAPALSNFSLGVGVNIMLARECMIMLRSLIVEKELRISKNLMKINL